MSPVIDLTHSASIATITLNRPARGNAIDMQMVDELLAAARECDANESVRCVVIRAAGRLFSAGGDLAFFERAGSELSGLLSELAAKLHTALVHLASMRKPLLTLVNGPVAGAGLSIALAGDVVLASNSAHFTCAYTAVGLTPDGGLTWLLPRLVGVRQAQEMLLTNRRVYAKDAEAMGLITRAVDDHALADEGARTAAALAESATSAVGTTRSLLLRSFESSYETQLAHEARAIAMAAKDAEAIKRVASYVAKLSDNAKGASCGS